MSAYGSLKAPERVSLAPRIYPLASPSTSVVVFPLRRDELPDDLVDYLRNVFNAVVEAGATYPQEDQLDSAAFSAYYLAYDLFLGILAPAGSADAKVEVDGGAELVGSTLEGIRNSRSWAECVAGMYYVKPNYPGRSSHNCNAGFVVPTAHRGLKIGLALGRSYLYYGPRLGYKASVFNLVYANNVASLRIWDSLGFQRVGLIPEAGRLRDGEGEAYVDAVVKKLDGRDVSKLEVESMRSHFALVAQEPTLYDGTLKENVLWGSPTPDSVTQEQIEAACRDANILDFVKSLPDGFETSVGSKGAQLSGGQKQRLALARALIRQPRVLLLDEATSALDSESEKVVQRALDQAAKGRTTIAVAHRLTTIQHADLIVVLLGGKVHEHGKHAELMRKKGMYFELVSQQTLDR